MSIFDKKKQQSSDDVLSVGREIVRHLQSELLIFLAQKEQSILARMASSAPGSRSAGQDADELSNWVD